MYLPHRSHQALARALINCRERVEKSGGAREKASAPAAGDNNRVISLYARYAGARDSAHLQKIYGLEDSPEMICTITDEVMLANGNRGR